jgi:hypothetical protein
MYIPFEKMPESARVWVYQADRDLSQTEVEIIENTLKSATNNWAAHGSPLLSSFQILYNRFVVVATDESMNAASGCSIDASTRWLKDLGTQLNIDFFDRSQAYLEGETIKTFSIFQAKKQIENGIIHPDSLVFINNIHTVKDLFSLWKSKAVNTYLKKYWVGQTV